MRTRRHNVIKCDYYSRRLLTAKARYWYLSLTKWHSDGFLRRTSIFPISQLLLHQRSVFVYVIRGMDSRSVRGHSSSHSHTQRYKIYNTSARHRRTCVNKRLREGFQNTWLYAFVAVGSDTDDGAICIKSLVGPNGESCSRGVLGEQYNAVLCTLPLYVTSTAGFATGPPPPIKYTVTRFVRVLIVLS
jgi:hypothetical protein